MSVTIKDIAKIANVSHTTVSRALNDSPLISSQTREMIKKIAEDLHYTPNVNARSLVLERSYNIGLFFSTIDQGTSSTFFYEVVRGVNTIIKGQYNLIVKAIDDYTSFAAVNKKSFDGIIVMSQSTKDNRFIYHVQEKQIPIAVLNREVKDFDVINILSDDRIGVYKAMEYIIGQGHRKIAIIEGKKGFKSTQLRKQGFLDGLDKHHITIPKAYMVQGNYDMESGYGAMLRLLKLSDRPTAVFCSNDDMAVGAMKAIVEKGLRIPEDLSVLGFDDNVFSAFLSPALTTVKRPIQKISEEGAKTLLQIVENGTLSSTKSYSLHTELVIRDSVKPI